MRRINEIVFLHFDEILYMYHTRKTGDHLMAKLLNFNVVLFRHKNDHMKDLHTIRRKGLRWEITFMMVRIISIISLLLVIIFWRSTVPSEATLLTLYPQTETFPFISSYVHLSFIFSIRILNVCVWRWTEWPYRIVF